MIGAGVLANSVTRVCVHFSEQVAGDTPDRGPVWLLGLQNRSLRPERYRCCRPYLIGLILS